MPKVQGHITITRRPKDGADGKNAVRLDLTNQNASILYDGEGTNISGTITSEAKLYEGASEVEGVEFGISERSGCDESQATIDSATGVVTITGLSTSGYLIVQVTYKEVTYAAKLVLTKIVGNVKYDLVVTPNAIAYNSTTGEKSADEIAVQVYRTAVTSNGNSERIAVGSITNGYMLIDGTARITSWNSSGHKIAVDTTKTEHTIAIYAGEVGQDAETIPINGVKNGADGKTAYSPKIGDNGNWWFYDDSIGAYVDSGRPATGDEGHSPYIGENGNWFEYNTTTKEYEDTGVKAKGTDAYSPYIGDNGNWFFYNDETGQYEDSGRSATGDDGHSPYIGENGNWYEWDAATAQYTDTGMKAKGSDAHSPYVGTNGNWFFYDDTAGEYVDSGRSATGDDGHSPEVGENGNWYEWDATTGAYVDTGIKAQGDKGADGVTYYLQANTSSVHVKNGTPDVSRVYCLAYKKVGTSEATTTEEVSMYYGFDTLTPTTAYSGGWVTVNVARSYLCFIMKHGGVTIQTLKIDILWDGIDGTDGTDGTDGKDGNGISEINIHYGTSTSNVTPPGTWSTSIPTVEQGSYLWTRTTIVYTDTSKADKVSYTVARQGKDGIGEKGLPGCIYRQTKWETGKTYRNDEVGETTDDDGLRYIDVCTTVSMALLSETFSMYICQQTHSSSEHDLGETGYWKTANNQKPIATTLLLAKQIIANYIDTNSLTADEAFIAQLNTKNLKSREITTENVNSGGFLQMIGNVLQMFNGSGTERLKVHGGELSDLSASTFTSPTSAVTVSGSKTFTNTSTKTYTYTRSVVYSKSITTAMALTLPSQSVTFALTGSIDGDRKDTYDVQACVEWLVDDEVKSSVYSTLSVDYSSQTISDIITLPSAVVNVASGSHTVKMRITINYTGGISIVSGDYVQGSISTTVAKSSIVWAATIRKTEIANNGFRVALASNVYFAVNLNGSTNIIEMMNGSYGFRVSSSGLQYSSDSGTTWKNINITTS